MPAVTLARALRLSHGERELNGNYPLATASERLNYGRLGMRVVQMEKCSRFYRYNSG